LVLGDGFWDPVVGGEMGKFGIAKGYSSLLDNGFSDVVANAVQRKAELFRIIRLGCLQAVSKIKRTVFPGTP
jgi:hypothetical protein